MRNFIKGVVEWKLSACAIFTAATFFYLLVSFFYGAEQVSTATLWGLFWASVAGALCQAVCFSQWLIKKLRYTWRSLLFVALFLPALSLIAWRTGWFQPTRSGRGGCLSAFSFSFSW